MSQKIVIVMRPDPGTERLDALRTGVGRLRAHGHQVEVRTTFEPGDGVGFARAAVESGADVVVAAGGDGTLNEVVNGLGGAERRPRLAVVPLGTANDFAVGMGLPEGPAESLELAVTGRARAIDLPSVNGRYFLNVSTGGFGAEATEQAPAETKRLLGSWAYLITGAKQFVDLRPVAGTVDAGGRRVFEGEFLLFAVGNAKQTGGGSMLTPRAELDDGLLDLLVVRAVARMDFFSMLPDLRAGTHLESPDIVYAQTPSISIVTEQTLSVNADGEPIRGNRFDYALDGRPIEVMVP